MKSTMRTQFRIGRTALLDTTVADFETKIRDDLGRMLGSGGARRRRTARVSHARLKSQRRALTVPRAGA